MRLKTMRPPGGWSIGSGSRTGSAVCVAQAGPRVLSRRSMPLIISGHSPPAPCVSRTHCFEIAGAPPRGRRSQRRVAFRVPAGEEYAAVLPGATRGHGRAQRPPRRHTRTAVRSVRGNRSYASSFALPSMIMPSPRTSWAWAMAPSSPGTTRCRIRAPRPVDRGRSVAVTRGNHGRLAWRGHLSPRWGRRIPGGSVADQRW